MSIEDLTKQQIILLCILVAFVSSIATGITVVTLLEQSPQQTIATPINRIIRETVEKVVPSEATKQTAALSAEETKLLNQLKTVGSFVATINVKNDKDKQTLAGQGLFFGDDRVIVTPALPELKEKESYIVTSIFGDREVAKIISEKDYSIIELKKIELLANPPAETPPPIETAPTDPPAENPPVQ